MERRERRRIILTHWNAGVFRPSTLPRILRELVIYALLYDDVLIREEDLITNRHITRFLFHQEHLRIFEELLTAGLVKLLRMPENAYHAKRQFDPVRLPISARVEEHERRRSYKGRPWKATAWEWQLFQKLDHIVVSHEIASRPHAEFPPDNQFASKLAELLENRKKYLGTHPVFRFIHTDTAKAFINFCRDSEAWLRFLHKSGVRSNIVGPERGFYRSAAYQCLPHLPTPRSMQRLVESVYAAVYCSRESSDGRYGDSDLVELPYHYESKDERQTDAETVTKIQAVPTGAAVSIEVGSGIAEVLTRTRESPQFEHLQKTLDQLGSAPSEAFLPTEAAFSDAWGSLCAIYTECWKAAYTKSLATHKTNPRFAIFAYLLAKVFGLIILPHDPSHSQVSTLAEEAIKQATEYLGPSLVRNFRASLKTPAVYQFMKDSANVRCSRVLIDKKESGQSHRIRKVRSP